MRVDESCLRWMCAVAREAGAILLERGSGPVAVDTKRTQNDLVTEFDRRSEALLVERIRATYPGTRILAEEGGELEAGSSPLRWLIDPLDGTTNFTHGLPFYCVSIGLEQEGRLIAGVVEAPALGWTFSGRRGGGAFLGDRRLAVSTTEQLGSSLLATGFPYDRATNPDNNLAQFGALKKRTHGVRRIGAAALDLCMVAAGWLDGYWEKRLKPWDLAAGALLVEEAGGKVTSFSGGPFLVDTGEAIATNGRIHEQLVSQLAAPFA
jgi:myo-inositol-1(or 4)-monophosphatase